MSKIAMIPRRQFLSLASLTAARSLLAETGPMSRLGICAFSCHQRFSRDRPLDALTFYRYGRELGADGVQTPLREAAPAELRAVVEKTGGYYEADLHLPAKSGDWQAFEHSVAQAKAAGASIGRCVLMGGRRYEVFRTLEQFQAFTFEAKQRLQLAEPIMQKHGMKLAVENHKDHLSSELAELMQQLSSEWLGVLVDTGNNLALLEDAYQAVEALLPYALSVHLKDMALKPYDQGFLLSEVPLGEGMLDLQRMVKSLRQRNAKIVLNLEMATRDPLRIPCLTEDYFTTFPDRKAQQEAAMQRAQQHAAVRPTPSVTDKEDAVVLAEEEQHNRSCLAWMERQL
jgi:3-oxoisoapionate decarboxylase